MTRLRVVFDVNVWLHAYLGPHSEFPYLQQIPPTTSNSSADCLSLALDGDRFSVYLSPHILRNIAKVLRSQGLSEVTAARVLDDFVEIALFSGGSVVDPDRSEVATEDHEDNLILDLVQAVGAEVLVTLDAGLIKLSGWKGRAFIQPRQFVALALGIAPR